MNTGSFATFRLLSISALRTCVILSVIGCLDQQPRVPTNGEESSLRQFLQKYLSDPAFEIDKTTRFSSALVNLGDNAREGVVVYVTSRGRCGSGGCTLLVLEPHGSSYKVIGNTTIVWPPIRILRPTTNGYHDLGVWVQGGGIQPGYEAVLPFDGKAYPGNPSVPPAKRAARKMAGEVLIGLADEGKPLYQ